MAIFFLRSRINKITLLFFSFSFSVLSAEFFLRQFYPQIKEQGKMFEYDPNLGWRFIPNKKGSIVYGDEAQHWIKTNSLGFRDNALKLNKSGHNTILVLGDSFVSNISVKDDQVFTERMENRLKKTDVLNFGVNGYGQVQEYLLLKKWFPKINPDLVILMIYIRNDFKDNIGGYWRYPRPFVTLDDKNSELIFHPPPPRRPNKEQKSNHILKILGKSHFYKFLNKKTTRLKRNYFDLITSEKTPSLKKPPEYYLCHTQPSLETKVMHRTMEATLMKIADYLNKRNVPLVFVLAPSFIQVNDKLWKEKISNRSKEPQHLKPSLPNKKLMEFSRKNKFLMIDLLPIFKSKSSKGDEFYNQKEQHWNAEGNRMVSDVLMDYLKNNNLISWDH